ncbi:MAG: leucine-rich repeat domain-containing protein [Bacteroidetes bacterium]|nr:leucine-rich repeat domain-containing protein [Bacteroidota bacterium]
MKVKNYIIILFLVLTHFAYSQEDSLSNSYKRVSTYSSYKISPEDSANVIKLVLKGKKLSKVPIEIFKLTALEYLDLSGNKLDSIPKEIGQLKNLKVLILDGNKLEALPEELYQLKNLQVLRLGKNNIFYMSAKIGQLTNLSILDLWDNNVAEFPEEISNLQSLKVLDLRSVSMNEDQQFQIMKLLPNTKVLMDVSCNCN